MDSPDGADREGRRSQAMTALARTHRDTLAFVLVMAGMTAWAMFPAIALTRDSAQNEQSVVGLALCIGCLLGSAVAASTFRDVAVATAAVAGALTSALSLGVVVFANRRVVMTLDELTASIVLLSTLAAIAGMYLGRTLRPRPGLAAAAVVFASLGAGLILAFLLDPSDDDGVLVLVLAIIVLTPTIGTVVATLLCEGMPLHARSVGWWLFGLMMTMIVIVAIADSANAHDRHDHFGPIILGGTVIGALVASGGALVTIVMHKLRPPKEPVVVPQAQVVDR
jgi:hypothetical protein